MKELQKQKSGARVNSRVTDPSRRELRARVRKMGESELRDFIATNPRESLRYLVEVVAPSVERRIDAMFRGPAKRKKKAKA